MNILSDVAYCNHSTRQTIAKRKPIYDNDVAAVMDRRRSTQWDADDRASVAGTGTAADGRLTSYCDNSNRCQMLVYSRPLIQRLQRSSRMQKNCSFLAPSAFVFGLRPIALWVVFSCRKVTDQRVPDQEPCKFVCFMASAQTTMPIAIGLSRDTHVYINVRFGHTGEIGIIIVKNWL
jgi:hypothetical protein